MKFSPFKTLCAVGLLAVFSSTISKNPSLPLLVNNFGGDQSAIGIVAGVSALSGVLFSFPAGAFSDRLGRHRMLLLSGVIFSTAPFFYLMVSGIWQIGLIRFYHGLATAIFGPVAMAYVADLHQFSRGEKMGWFSTATLIGRFSAPALGGLVLAWSATGERLEFTPLYLLCGGAGIAAFLGMLVLPKGRKAVVVDAKPHQNTPVLWQRSLAELLCNRAIMITCLVEAALLFSYGIFETFLPIRGLNIGLSTWQIGLCVSSQIITIAITKPVLGRFSDRHGRPPQIFIGTFFAGLAMAFLAFAHSFMLLISVSMFLGLSISVVTSASAAYIADLSKEGAHGSAMGILGSIMDIGHALGPIVGGLLAVSFGLTVSFMSGCVVLFICGICFMGTSTFVRR